MSDPIYREELLRALAELEQEESIRKIKDESGNMFAEVTVSVKVNWFNTLGTENISQHLVVGSSQEEVSDEFDSFFREIADTEKLLVEIKTGLLIALEDKGGQHGRGPGAESEGTQGEE